MYLRHLTWRVGALTLAIFLFLGPMPKTYALELVMFRQDFCEACTLWDKEVGQVYGKTRQGQQAPIRDIDIHAERPGEFAGIGPVVYTPTFVLVDEGKEIGRIVGYGGEDFFWSLLDQLLERLPDPAMSPKLEPVRMRD
jgi:hypothetical protein